jgi:uncharacterized protein YoxC
MKQAEKLENGPVTVILPSRTYTGAFVTIGMLLVFLFVTNLYTLDKLTSARHDMEDMHAATNKEVEVIKTQNQELFLKYSILKGVQANQIDQLRSELDTAAKRLGASTGQVLDRARIMAAALQKERDQRYGLLQQNLAEKADGDDVATLTDSVSAAQSQLGRTERSVDVLAGDLSRTRSEIGSQISSAQNQLQALRQLSDKEYYEFTLAKDRLHHVAGIGVGLELKKTNVKGQRFSIDLIANDQKVENKDRNIFEPILFVLGRSRIPCELVITTVGDSIVTGYISIPKGVLLEGGPAPQV